jgi:hypothetical protein
LLAKKAAQPFLMATRGVVDLDPPAATH